MLAGKKTKEQAIEQLRAKMVVAMRQGEQLCINLEREVIDFNEWSSVGFPSKIVMDPCEGRKPENYIKIVLAEEMFDKMSAVVDGNYYMGSEFMIIVMTHCDDDEHIEKILSSLPHNNYEKFTIQ